MIRRVLFALVLSVPASSAGATESQETLRLSKGLYYDCAVSSDQEPAKTHELDVTYFEYADRPAPQVNFFDPSKLISEQTGWMPKDRFVLSRVVSDGQVFIWLGRSDGKSSPSVDAALELKPKPNEPERATLSLVRFTNDAEKVSAQRFEGQCGRISGKAAWDRFQNGGTK